MKEKTKQGIPRLLQLSEEKRTVMGLSVLFSTVGTILQLSPFLAVYQIMSSLLNYVALNEALNTSFMIQTSLYGLVGLLCGYLFSYLGGMLSHRFSYRTICSVRLKVAEHIGRLPMGYFSNRSVGKTKQILDADVEHIEGFLSHLFPDFISTLVMILTMFIAMFSLNIWLALACFIPIIVGFICQFAVMIKILKSGGLKENFDALENISSSSLQYVKGMPSIKIFGQTVKSFRKFHDDIMSYRNFTMKMTEIIRPGYVLFRMFILSVATFILPVGLLFFLKSPNDISFVITFIFFLILGPGVATPTLKLKSFAESMNVITEGIRRIDEVLNEDILSEPTVKKIPTSHDISFKDVTFSYDKEKSQVLNKVSFLARQGEITALVGPSGAGKSTIAELIPRFWDVGSGEICIGGINIKEIRAEELMEQMSFVFQESFLFSDTIFQNIALGKPNSTKEEIIHAAKVAQCHDFIMALPHGYKTKIGDGGIFLSGGETQRLSVARAVLKDAPILIFDEATAYADAENENKMQAALGILIKNKTVIMIAHRLTTICNANQILVVVDGKIKEHGQHKELLENKDVYFKMWNASMRSNTWKIETREGGISK